MLKDVPIPRMARVLQKLPSDTLDDIPAEIKRQITRQEIAGQIRPGMSIAVTAGSRGIANNAMITRETVRVLKSLGGRPFVIPAMGSHGGASAEGQQALLASLGITEDSVGAPVRATMEVVQVGSLADGRPVYVDRYAAEADGIVAVGRVKPHTCYRGPFESGLFKMLAIGLGKHQGATACHLEGFEKMAENVQLFARVVRDSTNILFALAILENARDETCRIVAVETGRIEEQEPGLLEEARRLMAKIHIDDIDVMIVDQIGKNHSGDGMDPNVTGSFSTPQASGGPAVRSYVVLDLSEETHGNSLGVGMAHFTTQRLFEKADLDAVYANAITAKVVVGARMPMVLRNDSLAIRAAIYISPRTEYSGVRVVRIANSAHVDQILVSESLLDEVRGNSNLRILSGPEPLAFDEGGNLPPFLSIHDEHPKGPEPGPT